MIVSGGFAVVQPDSQLSINAVEGFALEDFSADVSILRLYKWK
jgi:F-type H+-transporting ATPase subunit delta